MEEPEAPSKLVTNADKNRKTKPVTFGNLSEPEHFDQPCAEQNSFHLIIAFHHRNKTYIQKKFLLYMTLSTIG